MVVLACFSWNKMMSQPARSNSSAKWPTRSAAHSALANDSHIPGDSPYLEARARNIRNSHAWISRWRILSILLYHHLKPAFETWILQVPIRHPSTVGILPAPTRRAAEMVVPFTGTAAVHETSPHQGEEGIDSANKLSEDQTATDHGFWICLDQNPGISRKKSETWRKSRSFWVKSLAPSRFCQPWKWRWVAFRLATETL